MNGEKQIRYSKQRERIYDYLCSSMDHPCAEKIYEDLKKETFLKTYNAISEQFKDIFHKLSDGEGTLILENEEKFNSIFEEIKGLVINSKNKIYTTINTEMLNLYWHIGKIIIEFQKGNKRANYGDLVLEKLSIKLTE